MLRNDELRGSATTVSNTSIRRSWCTCRSRTAPTSPSFTTSSAPARNSPSSPRRSAAAYRRMIADYDAVKLIFDAVSYTPIGWGKAGQRAARRASRRQKWLRRIAMSGWEIIRDNFEDDHCRSFMLWMAFRPWCRRNGRSRAGSPIRWSMAASAGAGACRRAGRAHSPALARLIGRMAASSSPTSACIGSSWERPLRRCRMRRRQRLSCVKAVLSTVHIASVEMARARRLGR